MLIGGATAVRGNAAQHGGTIGRDCFAQQAALQAAGEHTPTLTLAAGAACSLQDSPVLHELVLMLCLAVRL